jgi:hypothetical protein
LAATHCGTTAAPDDMNRGTNIAHSECRSSRKVSGLTPAEVFALANLKSLSDRGREMAITIYL